MDQKTTNRLLNPNLHNHTATGGTAHSEKNNNSGDLVPPFARPCPTADTHQHAPHCPTTPRQADPEPPSFRGAVHEVRQGASIVGMWPIIRCCMSYLRAIRECGMPG
eukprot:12899255-Prorocentrum_lima.AAC.1